MCQASGTAGWERPASLSPSRAALPSAALSSVSHLKPDDLLSAYYVPGLSWPPSFQPLWALLLCAHTLPGLAPISGHFCLPLSPLARLTGSSRRGQGPLGLQSPVSAYTGACRQGWGWGIRVEGGIIRIIQVLYIYCALYFYYYYINSTTDYHVLDPRGRGPLF